MHHTNVYVKYICPGSLWVCLRVCVGRSVERDRTRVHCQLRRFIRCLGSGGVSILQEHHDLCGDGIDCASFFNGVCQVLHGFFVPGAGALEAHDRLILGAGFYHLVHWQRCDAWVIRLHCDVGEVMSADGGDVDELYFQFADYAAVVREADHMGMKPITAVLVAAQRQASVFPLQRVKVSHEEPFPIFHYNEPWRQEKHGEVVLLQKVFVLVAQGGWVIIVDVVLAFGLAVGTLFWHCAVVVTV